MAARVAGLLLVVPGCVLAVLGAATTTTDALIGWSLAGSAAGVLVALFAPRLWRGRRTTRSGPDVRAGMAAAAAFLAAYLVLAGSVAAFGGGFAVLVVLLLVVAAWWFRRRGRPEVRTTPSAEAKPRDVFAGTPVAGMATEELCTAWRRSYFHLLLATDERTHRLVVQRRQDFLDEIERRDRRGFLRWLDSGARAGSDPGPYLTTRS
jgi:hypothetical protein